MTAQKKAATDIESALREKRSFAPPPAFTARAHLADRGDRIIIYMPLVPETIVAMPACARIGAIHSVVFGGFSAVSLRDRIEDAGATLVVTADGGWRGGHSYVAYGPLAAGATILLYEGAPAYPDGGRFWKLCETHGLTIFYTAPTAIRALMKLGDAVPTWWRTETGAILISPLPGVTVSKSARRRVSRRPKRSRRPRRPARRSTK